MYEYIDARAVAGAGFSATVSNLQQKLESLQTSNTLMREDLNIAKTSIAELQQENSQLTSQTEQLQAQHSQQLQVRHRLSSCRHSTHSSCRYVTD